MRRGIAATALVASLALAATACGGSDSGSDKSDGPVTLTWWDTSNATNEAPTYKALVKEFEAAHKGIRVKYVNVPFDQAQNKFDTAAGATGAPDILRSEVGWTPAFAKKGFFLPLDGTEALKDPARRQMMLDRLPQGRFPTAEDIAAAIRFLAGPDAQAITGHILPVDAGLLAV